MHGIKRRSSLFNTQMIDHIYEDPHIPDRHLHLHYGDLSDSTNLIRIIQEVQPDEIYNLGAMSHVQVSFEEPEYTGALEFDATKPDGTPRKFMDTTKINNLGWKPSIKLNDGISRTIEEVMHKFKYKIIFQNKLFLCTTLL